VDSSTFGRRSLIRVRRRAAGEGMGRGVTAVEGRWDGWIAGLVSF
jgi:hypothetical protein